MQPLVFNSIYQPVLVRYAAAPEAGEVAFQGLGLANSLKGGA